MSIRNDDKKRAREKKARPDAMHRAVRFLLEQAKMNNRDITLEADHHMETLDAELGNKKELQATPIKPEVEAAAAPAAEQHEQDAEEVPGQVRQSSRFRR